MHHLGVPTTRALSLVLSGDKVVRDMFYDGNPQAEPGAIVCRVAPSFVRFGNFEIFTMRDDREVLRQLADFTITRDFPHLGNPTTDTYIDGSGNLHAHRTLIVHGSRFCFVPGDDTDNVHPRFTIDYCLRLARNYDPADTEHHRRQGRVIVTDTNPDRVIDRCNSRLHLSMS